MERGTKHGLDLSAKRLELLDALLREKQIESTAAATIPRRVDEGPVPLSFAQQRLWFLDQLTPNAATYNVPSALRLSGPLDIEALNKCLSEIVRRHEALRTTFGEAGGTPHQNIHQPQPFHCDVADLISLDEVNRFAEAQKIAREEAHQPFDLSSGPLFRVKVLRLEDDDHVVLFTMHHIVSDGWSSDVLIKEVATLYDAFTHGRTSPLPELPVQYADYAQWQRDWLSGEVLDTQLAFWKRQLAGAPATLNLPIDYARPDVPASGGEYRTFSLSAEVSQSLRRLSMEEGASLFMMLLAGFQTLLMSCSRQSDIVVGTPVAGRTQQETESLIGFFVNTLVLRTDLSGDPSLRALLKRVRENCLAAFDHQDVPFEKLVEALQPERHLNHTPFFQVMFALQNPMSASGNGTGDLSIRPFEGRSVVSRFDLDLSMTDTPKGITGALLYNPDLFADKTIARLIQHLKIVFASFGSNADAKLGALCEQLSELERQERDIEKRERRELNVTMMKAARRRVVTRLITTTQ